MSGGDTSTRGRWDWRRAGAEGLSAPSPCSRRRVPVARVLLHVTLDGRVVVARRRGGEQAVAVVLGVACGGEQ